MIRAVLALVFLPAFASVDAFPAAAACVSARSACISAANQAAWACRSKCERSGNPACLTACDSDRTVARSACRAVDVPCAAVCGVGVSGCAGRIRDCRLAVRADARICRRACRAVDGVDRVLCSERCKRERAAGESGCGYAVVAQTSGAATVPVLAPGRAADLTLLEPVERAIVDAADVRAAALRTRRVRVWLGAPGASVRVVQTKHGFPFGVPIDVRRFANADDRDWYTQTMAAHFNFAVVENTLKWAGIEPTEGMRTFANADADVAWGEAIGFPVKGHALMWGIVPPFSSSGVPPWALSRFSNTTLPPAEVAALREILRQHVVALMERYRGRLTIWDATNETLQAFAQWFNQRLGSTVVDDVFRWAHAVDPDAQLVFNEWIVEVFTGFEHPTAAEVRDRVLALRAAGVPVHAIGQQAHFVPAAAFVGVPVDLSQRTHLDVYATALDTLAEAGLPIHITETNVIAPDDPELRAAQTEGLLRIWWGHPSVEQVVFWGPWNKVAGRNEFDVGFWDDDRNLTRHGEAVLSLLNARWRTDEVIVADASGTIELTATHGEHVAEWTVAGTPTHAAFSVVPGQGTATIAVAP